MNSFIPSHGPEITKDGVRFTLWAPSAMMVDLCLANDKIITMEAAEDGWFEAFVAGAGPGTRYHFLIDGKEKVPDPASAFQPDDVSGESEVIDLSKLPEGPAFTGRPWNETVIYELHVGTFTPEGTYAGVEGKLDYLAELGITAIELMPLNDVPGDRNWGYDGVLLSAPNATYGRPEDLKRLINAAHSRGIMVFLDVVYNHFGPEANHLHSYAEDFFNPKHNTGWGPAVNLEGDAGLNVRSFLKSNARRWLLDYGFDGLRFDAVHALKDDSPKHFLYELSEYIRAATPGRYVHLMLENEANQARYLERSGVSVPHFNAQWGDDFHNALHALLTGEREGYYSAFADQPFHHLTRALTDGFAYQGEYFPLTKGPRGERSDHLPPEATIFFDQNHDQIGNRALGERLSVLIDGEKLRQSMALVLLNPHIPMLFMGQEAGVKSPFYFFCAWEGEMADKTREGRRKEFASFASFSTPEMQEKIPDPTARQTFEDSRIDWDEVKHPENAGFLKLTRELLEVRETYILPLLNEGFRAAQSEVLSNARGVERGISVAWQTSEGRVLQILANFSDEDLVLPKQQGNKLIWNTHGPDHPEFLQPAQLLVFTNG